jgi:hypothetical protein
MVSRRSAVRFRWRALAPSAPVGSGHGRSLSPPLGGMCGVSPGPIAGPGIHADMAQLAERDLAKVEAAGSNPAVRSTARHKRDSAVLRSLHLAQTEQFRMAAARRLAGSRGRNLSPPAACPGGETGRRARFRPVWGGSPVRVQLPPRTRRACCSPWRARLGAHSVPG